MTPHATNRIQRLKKVRTLLPCIQEAKPDGLTKDPITQKLRAVVVVEEDPVEEVVAVAVAEAEAVVVEEAEDKTDRSVFLSVVVIKILKLNQTFDIISTFIHQLGSDPIFYI